MINERTHACFAKVTCGVNKARVGGSKSLCFRPQQRRVMHDCHCTDLE